MAGGRFINGQARAAFEKGDADLSQHSARMPAWPPTRHAAASTPPAESIRRMSIETIALFEVPDAKQAVNKISECAATMPDALCRVGERFAKWWRPKQWKYQSPDELVGPGGFSIRAEGRILNVHHALKFYVFAQQGEVGRCVLEAFQFLGRVIGSDEMIVCHELLPYKGDGIDMIAEYLTNKFGPAAKDWAELENSDTFHARCWMRLSVGAQAMP
jgi:hypothetical protein